MRKTAIVCGAGIGGLTTAHELARQGFKVTVYERNPIVGGLARSRYLKEDGESYPTEYSWRVYGDRYDNLLRLFKEIPLKSGKNKYVFDNLIKVSTYIFPRFDKDEVVVSGGKGVDRIIEGFPNRDNRKIINKMCHCLSMSKARMASFDDLKWKDYCADLSEEAQKYMVRMWGPLLGMDPSHMNFPVIARLMKVLTHGYFTKADSLYLMNQPTNDGWFDHWIDYLENLGVDIKTEHEVLDFKIEENRVTEVIVENKSTGQKSSKEANYIICNLPVEAAAQIVSANPSLQKFPSLSNTIPLAKIARQVQLSVQIFLEDKLDYPTDQDFVLYLPDTPWALIIEPQAIAWRQTHSTDKNIQTVLSVGICQTDAPGIKHKKPFTKCNEKEVAEETWAQIVKSYHMSKIKTTDGRNIKDVKMTKFYMWDSFKFDKEKKEITIWEPKFSNNVGSYKKQPDAKTEIENFYFASGYTKTDRYIYSMETAVEAGTTAANHILLENGKRRRRVYPFSTGPFFFKPLTALDRLLFEIGLPHLSKLFFGSSIILMIIYIISLAAILGGTIWKIAN